MIAFICATMDDLDDRKFMEQLYQDFERTMFSIARRYVYTQADQQDIVQESVLSLIKNISTIRSMDRCILASYIVSTIKHTAINHINRQKRSRNIYESIEDETFVEPKSPSLSLDSVLISAESLAELWDGLAEEDRLVLEGKYILGCTDEDLAFQLKCKPSSIRMKLTRARRRAFEHLSEKKEV